MRQYAWGAKRREKSSSPNKSGQAGQAELARNNNRETARTMASAGGGGGLRTNPMAMLSDSDTSEDSSDEDQPPKEKTAAPQSGISSRLKFERPEVLMPWERSSAGSRNGSVTPPSASSRGTRGRSASGASASGASASSLGRSDSGDSSHSNPSTGRSAQSEAEKMGSVTEAVEARVDTLMPWELDGGSDGATFCSCDFQFYPFFLAIPSGNHDTRTGPPPPSPASPLKADTEEGIPPPSPAAAGATAAAGAAAGTAAAAASLGASSPPLPAVDSSASPTVEKLSLVLISNL